MTRMRRAYLDTNVYSAIATDPALAEDVEALHAALTSGNFVAPISLANLDELLGQLETDRPATIARLSTVRGLVGFHGMLKRRGIFSSTRSRPMPPDLRHHSLPFRSASVAGSYSCWPTSSPEAQGMTTICSGLLATSADSRIGGSPIWGRPNVLQWPTRSGRAGGAGNVQNWIRSPVCPHPRRDVFSVSERPFVRLLTFFSRCARHVPQVGRPRRGLTPHAGRVGSAGRR